MALAIPAPPCLYACHLVSKRTYSSLLSNPTILRTCLPVLDHRSKAISAVQANLLGMNTAVSDENIAAVFNLLCVEVNIHLPASSVLSGSQIRPDRAQRLVHMNGLRCMIRMRGGLHGLSRGLQSFLLRFVGYLVPKVPRVLAPSPLHPIFICSFVLVTDDRFVPTGTLPYRELFPLKPRTYSSVSLKRALSLSTMLSVLDFFVPHLDGSVLPPN